MSNVPADAAYTGDPSATPTASVRFLSGDSGDANGVNFIVHDPEIAWLLTQENNNVYLAAADVCERLADYWLGKWSSAVTSKQVGDLTLAVDYKTKSTTFATRADRLRARNTSMGGTGVMFDDTIDTDGVGNWAALGQFDNFGTGTQDQSSLLGFG